MSFVAHRSSTQSRHVRPGTLVNTIYASGVYERTTTGRNILSWPLGQYGNPLGYPSLSNKYTTDIVLRLVDLMQSGYASLGSYAPDVEEKLAETLISIYAKYLRSPDCQVRFASNGTDVTQAAVALARAVTGRQYIISVGYHGGSSPVFNFAPQDRGVLEENHRHVVNVEFENFILWSNAVSEELHAAALVVEIPPMRDEEETKRILIAMRQYCDDNGVVLILDEVVTGFRYSLAGALGFYDCIKADFICLGKALSTYGKVSALIAPTDIMELLKDEVFFSMTYNDHPLGIHDAILTIDVYKELGQSLYDHLDMIGGALKFELNTVFAKHNFPAEVIGHNSRTSIVGNQTLITQMCAKVIDGHDILLHRPQFSAMPHTIDHVMRTKRAVDSVLKEMGY